MPWVCGPGLEVPRGRGICIGCECTRGSRSSLGTMVIWEQEQRRRWLATGVRANFNAGL
jgi:hypothetical protein